MFEDDLSALFLRDIDDVEAATRRRRHSNTVSLSFSVVNQCADQSEDAFMYAIVMDIPSDLGI